MIENLVIVESPAKARTVGKFLGKGYTVKASVGHVRDLLRSQLSVDVENGFKPEYVVVKGRKKILSELQAKAKDKVNIYLAIQQVHLMCCNSNCSRIPVSSMLRHDVKILH